MSGGGLEPGLVLAERYRLRRLLGEGGMGWVWDAADVSTEQPVALKVLKSTKLDDRKRFQREVRAAAAIRHPNVIAVHDFLELPDGMLVIVMDLLAGETLGAVLSRDRRIPLPELAAIFLPVLAALEAAHALGIVHRDVKPDNIFLCENAAKVDVRVLDFGIAKLTAEDGLAARTQALTGTGSMVGTPYYMSPEQVFGDKDLDPRADIWSLGVVMYECLTGTRPTEGDTVGRVLKRIMAGEFDPITIHAADVPDDVSSLVARMLSADRDDRPRDLAEIRRVLERYVGPAAPRAAPPKAATAKEREDAEAADAIARADTNRGVSVAPTRPSRARTRIVAAGAVAALALVGSAALLRGRGDVHSNTPRERTSAEAFTTSEPPPAVSADAAIVAPAMASALPITKEPASAAPATASAVAARAPTQAVSRPACEKGEVVSEGHCCLRGHQWREGRCERPLATSF